MRYKCLILLSMLYILLNTFVQIIANKTTIIPIQILINDKLFFEAGTVIGIAWICLCDIIAEVYGMKISILLYWAAVICNLISISFFYYLVNLASPPLWNEQQTYIALLQISFYKSFIAPFVFFTAWYINIYFLTKWKLLLRGKHYWLRSVGSSIIGETIYTTAMTFIMHYLVAYLSTYTYKELAIRAAWLIFTKMILIAIFAFPSALIVVLLKAIEQQNQYQQFNPFKYHANNPKK